MVVLMCMNRAVFVWLWFLLTSFLCCCSWKHCWLRVVGKLDSVELPELSTIECQQMPMRSCLPRVSPNHLRHSYIDEKNMWNVFCYMWEMLSFYRTIH